MTDRETQSISCTVKIRVVKIVAGKICVIDTTKINKNLLLAKLRTPQFYGMPKVHTEKFLVPLLPIVS